MNEHFNHAKILVPNLQQELDSAQLPTETELHKLLIEWNNTQRDYPQDKCIHELFAEQVKRTPEAIAVVFEQEQLTYQELNAKANQLAHHLQSLGVEPEVLVGICVERSLEMVVGILGILKAGGAYVPLDPSYPLERLAFILEDTGVPILLTKAQQVNQLPPHQGYVVCLDTDWQTIASHSEKNPTNTVTAGNLAYVIYTSGSTGKPKGVLIEYQSLLNLVFWHQQTFSVSPTDRATQLASPAFDASVWELWPYLTAGASVYIANEQTRVSPVQLRDWLVFNKITICFLPIPLAESVLLLDWPVDVALRTLLTGGDKLHNYPLPSVPFDLVNNYGPTENTVVATCGFIPAQERTDRPPAIGRPITNTQIYLLDAQLQPVPIGYPGELYIGGKSLARGYLNRPDLTKEKFIPNPFSHQPGSRLYKTGDLARYLPDGNIEFLGRIDHQVKIRGFRIELGEIEAALRQYPEVREAVVIAREDIPGDKRLVAYLVENPQSRVLSQQKLIPLLRSFLQAKLPGYMVPDRFVILDALPLTPNGKVDRSSLPIPDATRPEQSENFVPPSTPTEEILTAIWAEVLGLEQVGINDNFFELGGNSLLATSIVSRIQEAFSIKLPPDYPFTAPTIASVSQSIENVPPTEFSSMAVDILPPLVPVLREKYIPLSFAQQSVWELMKLNPNSYPFNCHLTLHFTILPSPQVLEQSINEIIRRHEILRTSFTIVAGELQQVVAPSLTLPLNIVDLQHLLPVERDAEVQRIADQEARHKFNLASEPLIKTILLQLTKEEHRLLITIHYLIIDGWSIGILLQELRTLYSAFSIGKPSGADATRTPLPEPLVQYADFTLWEQKWLNAEVLEKQLAYWQKKLTNIPIPLNLLPTKQPQQSSSSRYASSYSLELPQSLGVAIKALSRSQGVTNFVIILTALKILLFKSSGQSEIIVIGEAANRRTPIIEKMIGWFINSLYLHSHVDNSQTGLTLLKQVKDTVSEAIAHQDIPVDNVFNSISKLKTLQTTFVSMTPPIPWQGEIFELEPMSLLNEGEVWDEEQTPLEIYIYSPNENSSIIKILGYYSTNLFTHESMEQFFRNYQKILQQLVECPEIKIAEFE
ncbi:MAG: amino acid adenylation domain-containing protein [Gloeotrichia echinulata CP02]|jgi:amino acid adenylation domain-containing protein|nr:amino acid adenylation domain-containing protein [Gloeotrichia echinulata DEX184]